MSTWVVVGVFGFVLLGVFANALRCPTRHWSRGRCERGLGHRGDHLASGHAWTTNGFARRSTR